MKIEGMSRFVGLYSTVIGAAFVAMPDKASKFFGMGDRPGLMRYFGVRDLALAPGLLAPGRPRLWLLLRGLADGSDAAITVAGLASGKFNRRALPVLAAALASCALSLAVAGRAGRR